VVAIDEPGPLNDNRRGLLTLGLALLGVFLIINYLVFSKITQWIDVILFRLFNTWSAGGLFGVIIIASSIYGQEIFWGGIVLILWIFGRGEARVTALCLIVTFLLSMVIGDAIKFVEFRPRPYITLSNVRLLISPIGDSSFPSGHALFVSAGAVVAWLRIKRRYSVPMLAESLLVSFSRMYVGVHYPLDVLAGWILGGAIACIAISQQAKFVLAYEHIIRKWKYRALPPPDGAACVAHVSDVPHTSAALG